MVYRLTTRAGDAELPGGLYQVRNGYVVYRLTTRAGDTELPGGLYQVQNS